MNNRGFEMSFAWLFGIVIGAAILFGAIYLVTTMIGNENELQGAKTSTEIGILLNPLETGFESSKSASFSMPVETRIYNSCDKFGIFGKQLVRVEQKSLGKWTETDLEVGFSNKYIFSSRVVEGKNFLLFSKPFLFPYKVSDLIYLTSVDKNYCFDFPLGDEYEEISEQISVTNQDNFFLEENNFPPECTNVCFSGNCDVKVNLHGNFVEKMGETLFFEGDALMFAAIFSDPPVYECNFKRLMLRAQELAKVYDDKARIISSNNCNTNLNLIGFSNSLNSIEDSSDLSNVVTTFLDLKMENGGASCKLW